MAPDLRHELRPRHPRFPDAARTSGGVFFSGTPPSRVHCAYMPNADQSGLTRDLPSAPNSSGLKISFIHTLLEFATLCSIAEEQVNRNA